MESADLGQRNDPTLLGWLNDAKLGRILLECEMGARAVVRDTSDILPVGRSKYVSKTDQPHHQAGQPG